MHAELESDVCHILCSPHQHVTNRRKKLIVMINLHARQCESHNIEGLSYY